MKATTLLLLSLLATGLAAGGADAPKMKRSELLRQAQMRRFGGLVERPDSLRGRIVFADARTGYGDDVRRVADELAKLVRIRVEVEATGKVSLDTIPGRVRELRAEGVVFTVDSPALPPLLVAPEGRWAAVNVAGLAAGGDGSRTRRRVRLELARAFAYLAGADERVPAGRLGQGAEDPHRADEDRVRPEEGTVGGGARPMPMRFLCVSAPSPVRPI